MKKLMAAVLAGLMLAGLLSGCASTANGTPPAGLAASVGNAVPAIRAATIAPATMTLHFSAIFIRNSSFLLIFKDNSCNIELSNTTKRSVSYA